MISAFQIGKAIRQATVLAIVYVLVLAAQVAHADTIVNIDFDDSTDLQNLFNADSSPHIFSQAAGGIGDSGVINSAGGVNTADVWTSKTGYSVTGAGDSYRLSAFLRTTESRGFAGFGIATSNVNEPIGSGYTSSGIGFIATDSTVSMLSSVNSSSTIETYDFELGAFDVLFPDTWYHFEVTILSNANNTFDVSLAISNSDSNGDIGSVLTIFSQNGITNTDIAQASSIHPYFSVRTTSGSRFDRLDDLTMRLSGGPTVVPDPEADSDSDGVLDTADPDDDNDGTADENDTFPLDETESNDNDNDGIGDREDIDDDNDGTIDTEDPTPNGESEPIDSDQDGVPDLDDRFPDDASEWADSDDDGVGDNADAFDNDPTETTDSDGDGVGDNTDEFPDDASETVDSDGDTVGDNADPFPSDPSESADTDNDGVGDNTDVFPNDATESRDTDADGVGDNADVFPDDASETLDSDNDGVGDNADVFPNDPSDTMDTDGDGVGDNADVYPADPTETLDTDGDGVGDNADAFPNDPSETMDSDGDGIGDNEDQFPFDPSQTNDTDGDGVADVIDAFDNDPTETTDTDGDGVGDNSDEFPNDSTESRDTDGDGVGDNADVFPDDPTETMDSDGDGVGDNADAFPAAFSETSDSDGDGVGDNADVFPNDATETLDTDGDGIGDNADAFPNDPTETSDSDGDGVGDNADAFPVDPTETMDSDGDGIGDNSDPTPLGELPAGTPDQDDDGVADFLDAFPQDAGEWIDSDEDGVGNNADAFDNDPTETMDADGDGVGDNADRFPLNANEQSDGDNDGIGDNADTDKDNDGTLDAQDAFPYDPAEQRDTDLDGIGNAADPDDDNDGVLDVDDAFPELASESSDNDNDGTGDAADLDDDNDGVADPLDAFPFNATESQDSDGDRLGNNADTDDDNDGYSDTVELLYQSDPLNMRLYPQGLDMDRDTLADSLERGSDTDGDGIGDEFDVDSDNDGIFDLIEASNQPVLGASLDTNNDGMMDDTALIGLTRVDTAADTDRDGIRDFRDLDSDNDGLSDTAEITPADSSFTDINNLQNDISALVLSDPDGDSLVNYRDLDSDNDGIPDLVEAGGTDIDGNGLADNFQDSNADGIDDGYFSVPLVLLDTDADGQQDYVDLDSDNDGQFDILGSPLVDADLDGDGRVDIGGDSNANGISDYADVAITNGEDSDGDGIDDRVDASVLGEPDFDSDGIADRYDADSQGDGLIQVASVKLPDNVAVMIPPVIAPAEPETPVIATTAISGGGCSIAGPAHPDMTLTALLVFAVIYLILIHAGTWRTLKSAMLIFLSTSLAAGPTVASVHTGLYLGIGGGASRLMPGIENAQLTDRDSIGMAWNATAGYQLTRSLGAELEYSNLGTTTLEPVGSIDYQDVNISGLYHLGGAAISGNGKKYSLYGRLGVGKISNQSNLQLERGSDAHWLAGVGVQVPVSERLSLRAEGVNYDEDVSRFGLAVTYQMGKISLPSLPSFGRKTEPKEHTEAAKAALTDNGSNNSTKIVSLKAGTEKEKGTGKGQPFLFMADQHEPHKPEIKSVSKLMETEPESKGKLNSASKTAPKIKWAISDTARQRMDEKPDDKKSAKLSLPTLSAALPSEIPAVSTASTNSQLPETVSFDFDKSSITRAVKDKMQPLIDYLLANDSAKVTLTGHTDSIGSEEYNLQLSIRRAEAVRQYLLQQGIDRKMIRILGAGEKRPVKSNAKPSGRKANRRVSIVVS
ncbi:MAG: OmpA family protein [Granulosicoccus sp.]